jgi:hypothetical protein
MKRTMRVVFSIAVVTLLLASQAWGQATTSLRGTVSDPSGAVVPSVQLQLTNTDTGVTRMTSTGASGDYEFLQVLPGHYSLKADAAGFRTFVLEKISLLVNTPATVNVTLQVGTRTETVSVTAEAPLLNTTDASLGNAISETQVRQLPMEARDVAGLYSLQPGVVYLGDRPDADLNNDTRSGAVNGARSDQSNITIDGVDANDQTNGYAFTTVLRTNPDAMQEFRVTTTNYNADQGRSSGAQVSIVTKSGTNNFHGSLYEYHRNTVTSANDWFIKRAELSSGEPNKAPKLLRNIFGGSVGGPIKKDRAFFFLNYEGRRDRQEESTVRIVPSSTLRQGMVKYLYCPNDNYDADGNCNEALQVQSLTGQQLTDMDPLHLGPNPVMLQYFQSYPEPNDNSVGDGLNYSGYRFPGSVLRHFDSYIGRIDYRLTASGNQSLFLRANLQPYDLDRGAPFLPGGAPLEINEDYSKGFVVGYTSILRPTLVNNFRWGLTRQSHAVLGSSSLPWNTFRGLDQGITRTRNFTLPVNNLVDDLSWVKGRHSFSFGTNVRFIRNPRNSYLNSFSDGSTNASWTYAAGIANTGTAMDPALYDLPAVDESFDNSYDFPLIALLGSVTEVDAYYNYDKSGNLLPQGAPTQRHFAVDEYEFYAQDSFRIKPNLTLTYGLRYELMSPPWETTGLEVTPNVNMGQWFQLRNVNMYNGIPSSQDPLIQFNLAGPANGKPGYYNWDKHNFAPRLALAYSPRPSSGFFKRLFGDGDKTSIRAGAGIVYDRIGAGLLNTFDENGSFGLSTLLTNPAAVETLACAPRLTSLHDIPTTDCSGTQLFIAAPPGNFPQTPPYTLDNGGFSISWGLDNSIKTPYSYMLDFSIERELPKNVMLQVAYVGHLAHRLLVQEDLAMPLNLADKKTGITYFAAADRLNQLAQANTPDSAINWSLVGPTAAYWYDMMQPLGPGGAYCGAGLDDDGVCLSNPTTSPLVAAYQLFSSYLFNETTALSNWDLYGIPDANNPDLAYFPITGPNSYWNRQYSSLYAWRSIANSSYHALQVNVRKRMAQGVQFDFNYTWSKSIDLMSDAERVGAWGGLGGQIINSWDYKQMRAVSDFDTTHQINANWVLELPFGRGRALGRNSRGVVEALIGGWQTSGIFRWTSGFPINVWNGYTWPTNWELEGNAMLIGAAPPTRTTKEGDGTVNMFSDPTKALQAYRNPIPGEGGLRNTIRGDGFFGLDMGLAKRWKMPYAESHSVQFRWEVFNVPNSNRFNAVTNTPEIDLATQFGNYTGLFTNPRVMQFALRYEF